MLPRRGPFLPTTLQNPIQHNSCQRIRSHTFWDCCRNLFTRCRLPHRFTYIPRSKKSCQSPPTNLRAHKIVNNIGKSSRQAENIITQREKETKFRLRFGRSWAANPTRPPATKTRTAFDVEFGIYKKSKSQYKEEAPKDTEILQRGRRIRRRSKEDDQANDRTENGDRRRLSSDGFSLCFKHTWRALWKLNDLSKSLVCFLYSLWFCFFPTINSFHFSESLKK